MKNTWSIYVKSCDITTAVESKILQVVGDVHGPVAGREIRVGLTVDSKNDFTFEFHSLFQGRGGGHWTLRQRSSGVSLVARGYVVTVAIML